MVRVDELHQLRNQLQRCTEEMRAAAGRLQEASPGSLGTAGLDQACAEFGDGWGHGIDRIAEGSARVGEGLTRAQQAYSGADEAVARMYGQAGGGDGGGGASGGDHG